MSKIRAAITALGHFVPETVLTNKDLEKIVETNDEWIVSRTGIKERRILTGGEPISFMAEKAINMLLERRGITADELDLILVATVTPDMLFPSTACVIQEKIGASKAWGFDVLAACSGFIFTLVTGTQFIESGAYKKVLIVGADKMSSITNFKDRNTCILFGDGAGCVLL
ncbi:MAG: 3-oxoacyl-ACP synthase, partial [Ignavibacteria bacterium]|nr:3-oxoacyl-ACP synthase [Ignavibacteria bacterium]